MALLLALCLNSTMFAAQAAEVAEPAEKKADKPTQSAQKVPDAKVEQTVIEDDSNRVEETRVRGQTQKVAVHPKNSPLPGYEIIMSDAGHDLSQGNGASRGSAGARVWRLLSF
ncbi:hypothetical protein [Roseateles koreensis]|uniref:Uncharacterized protein n=1 Tax=Roseateles koreensis TaxID=2987526 RepID=A0ABT5KTN7_9BURK|nr:hypothetical protein [Roseateles koreensis]MDC8786289.1 hypothetical protein [Roseateles koreensis]